MTAKYRNIFIIAFIVSCIFQAYGWIQFTVLDGVLWADQAKYVETGDRSHEFDFLGAYGHPGGPVIEGTIFIRNIIVHFYNDSKQTSYENSINIFLILFDSLIIACICVLCYKLKQDHLWWILVLITLSLNGEYYILTPPSAIAALLFVFISLITLIIYNKDKVETTDLLIWAAIGGLLVATRFDIGGIALFSYSLLLLKKVPWQKIMLIILGSIASFCIFDPFMWFMPVQHIKDLIYKMTYHYGDIMRTHVITFHELISFSGLAFISMLFAVVFVFSKKRIRVKSILSSEYICAILLLTAATYVIFVTAHEQAVRYFVPLLFLWEIFLPLFLFELISCINLKNQETSVDKNNSQRNWRAMVFLVLVALPLLSFLSSLIVGIRSSIFL